MDIQSNINLDLNSKKDNKFLTFLIIFMSFFLNQSRVLYGINVSLSDFCILIVWILLIYNRTFKIPINYFIFFLLLSISLLLMGTIFVPHRLNLTINFQDTIVEYTKLLISFFYLIIGFNISYINKEIISLKSYSVGGFIISFIGLIFNFLNINILNQLLYFESSRFRGLMIDPNYYAIIQISTLSYFIRNKFLNQYCKFFIYILNFIFILMSGSKTGLTTFLIYSVLLLVEFLLNNRKNLTQVIKLLFILTLFSLFNSLLKKITLAFRAELLKIFPVSKRLFLLFENLGSAVSQEGSARDIVWRNAINIFKKSPLLGVGVGTYKEIGKKFYSNPLVAHNTYLQILPEWGLLFSVVFFSYLLYYFMKISFNKTNLEILVTRDILLVFLIGSLGISLNNARMFWFFLGIGFYQLKLSKKVARGYE